MKGRFAETIAREYPENELCTKILAVSGWEEVRLSCEDSVIAAHYPRPINGILVAITVMNCTFASNGRLAI